ncbi:flagellar biosynthesis protein FlhF [Lachnobacterium bovis]|uniref:Flagellar biosynthesis protein FlhF n=1 Tax=Lachnobacterium bovis TaxID=140626 RepID=A0A1H9Q4S0_9FIRM|nr:flagellar biosynthesis protein FlhF [Lachnobacterium bovis]SER55447.1 SRP54-type protein, GTPase domain [Lachnobacterium bovis]
MTINKYQGKTREEALEKAKKELGENVVVMNEKPVKSKGILGAFKSQMIEITAAVDEEKESYTKNMKPFKSQLKTHESIDLSVDDEIEIPIKQPVSVSTEKEIGDTYSNPYKKGINTDTKYIDETDKGLFKSFINEREIDKDFSSLKDEGEVRNFVYKDKASNQKAQKPIFEQLNEKVALESIKKADSKTEEPIKRIIHGKNEAPEIDDRLENLGSMFEKKLGGTIADDKMFYKAPTAEEVNFVKILYRTLLSNEVSEKNINQILSEVEKFIRPGISLDTILSNVYQKLILRLGTPATIKCSGKSPKVVFFIGPTGVGKTTTIAKIASKYKMEKNKKVAFLTADTYRIAATEQLRVYANILDAPLSIIYSVEELNDAVLQLSEYDLIFVDTAGFSHKNVEQKNDTQILINQLDAEYEREVFLVLSATTKLKDLMEISDSFHEISDYSIIFTKLDETTCFGNILNIKLHSNADLSYVAYGQNVPDDLSVIDIQKVVKHLLGGK